MGRGFRAGILTDFCDDGVLVTFSCLNEIVRDHPGIGVREFLPTVRTHVRVVRKLEFIDQIPLGNLQVRDNSSMNSRVAFC
jgi:hypothetical protein